MWRDGAHYSDCGTRMVVSVCLDYAESVANVLARAPDRRKEEIMRRNDPGMKACTCLATPFAAAFGMLLVSLVVAAMARAAPLDDVNQYADRCAAELGAGAGAYLPVGLLPNPPDFNGTVEVPVYWNEKAISFELVRTDNGTRCSDAAAGCNAGNSRFEFLFDGKPGHKAGEAADGTPAPGAPAYPDGANTTGRIVAKANLRCDFWSHVNTNNGNGCLPGQRIARTEVGNCRGDNEGKACTANNQCGAGTCQDKVQWSFIFRRQDAARAGAPWGAAHPYFFNNFDAVAFKKDTGAVCWFDTLEKQSTTKDKWWESRVAGAPVPGPAGLPRPGGKDADKKARAVEFWMTPARVKANDGADGQCIACHGNGPIITSRWLNEASAFSARQGGEIPYWHPAGILADPSFKKFSEGTKPAPASTTGCSNCHAYWSTSASTTPGGFLARDMTSDASSRPALASNFRKQIDDTTGLPKQGKCAGGARDTMSCAAQTDCPAGACLGGQDAGILREMPHSFTVKAPDGSFVEGTPKDWDDLIRPAFTAMQACLQICVGGDRAGAVCSDNAGCPPAGTCKLVDVTQCDQAKPADVPKFFGAQERAASMPPGEQRVEAPLPADGFKIARANCVVAADGAETCDYQAAWQDVLPTAGDTRRNHSDYFSADRYFLQEASVAAGQKPVTKDYCLGTETAVTATTAALAASNWAKKYEAKGSLAACRAVQLRLCGGYTVDVPPGARPTTGHSPIDSRDLGQRGDTATACANRVQIKRGGYRLNRASGRFIQTVTLTNGDTVATPAPISYLLFNLSPNASLANASGSTAVVAPTGTAYIDANGGNAIAPGQSVNLTLEFINPSAKGITYDARVRAGAGDL